MNIYSFLCEVKDTKDKKQEIINASLEIIREEGISGLTIVKIAKKSNIATGTIYLYFKNKDILINKIYEYIRENITFVITNKNNSESPFKLNSKRIWFNYLKHRINNYNEHIFLEQYYRSKYISNQQKSILETLRTPIHDIIQRGKNEMLIKQNISEHLLFIAISGFIKELVNAHYSGIINLTDEYIEQAYNLSWDMLKE